MTQTLIVTGMSCQNCVRHAREALESVPGVESATVDLESGRATVVGQADAQALIAALDEEGYGATEA